MSDNSASRSPEASLKPGALELSRQIRPAMTQLYVTYFRLSEQSDLTGPQLSIMTRLRDKGLSRISEVARDEGIRMPTASNALHQLEQRDLVRRVRDQADRRGVRVELTELGEKELARVGEERELYFAQMLSSLSDEDLEQAKSVVGVINNLARSYNAEALGRED